MAFLAVTGKVPSMVGKGALHHHHRSGLALVLPVVLHTTLRVKRANASAKGHPLGSSDWVVGSHRLARAQL